VAHSVVLNAAINVEIQIAFACCRCCSQMGWNKIMDEVLIWMFERTDRFAVTNGVCG